MLAHAGYAGKLAQYICVLALIFFMSVRYGHTHPHSDPDGTRPAGALAARSRRRLRPAEAQGISITIDSHLFI